MFYSSFFFFDEKIVLTFFFAMGKRKIIEVGIYPQKIKEGCGKFSNALMKFFDIAFRWFEIECFV